MNIKHFLLIRHGKTDGNLERRYIGNPDEPLCAEGLQEVEVLVKSGRLPPVEELFAGTALRCRQTAGVLFPHIQYKLCSMQEIDFGVFKGKNADDLLGDKDYEAWLRTNCMGDIPGGDSVAAFRDQCCLEFERIAEASICGMTAMVIHGGNIMSILERFALPPQGFYDYYVPNCGFFLCRYENSVLTIESQGGII